MLEVQPQVAASDNGHFVFSGYWEMALRRLLLPVFVQPTPNNETANHIEKLMF